MMTFTKELVTNCSTLSAPRPTGCVVPEVTDALLSVVPCRAPPSYWCGIVFFALRFVPFRFSKRYLHGVIDLAVRSLDPATENVSRESYGALHPDETRPHQVTGPGCVRCWTAVARGGVGFLGLFVELYGLLWSNRSG